MSRFVILEHDHPVLHWDFLLDDGADRVPTWRLKSCPSLHTEAADGAEIAAETISAEELPAHRRMYLDYEGPVTGDRGQVIRWDAGLYIPLASHEGRLELRLEGEKLQGFATLFRPDEETGAGWLFSWLPDRSDGDI